ncbi:hypothetical protein QFZ49_008197 [Streptomyces turgidiscabies]|uniref:Uncharacterized protein n=1 Tax=Streptomyces turgidiscabies TaxID=85558 RepID=A0ABU0S1V6_9ACTN|nr:hypothetical protein [Streptomyces turgidiscabies]
MEVVVAEGGRLDVEADGDVAGLRVAGQRADGLLAGGLRPGRRQRVLDGQDVGEFLQVGDCLGHLGGHGGQRLGRVPQDDLAAVTAGCRIVLLEDVEALLRLDSGQGEVVGVLTAEGPVEHLEHGERDQPGHDDDHEVPGTPLAQPEQSPTRVLPST